jgi:hypothetical protein
MLATLTNFIKLASVWLTTKVACSLELSSAYFQPVNSIFLSQQIGQPYFQPFIFSQANVPDFLDSACQSSFIHGKVWLQNFFSYIFFLACHTVAGYGLFYVQPNILISRVGSWDLQGST